MTMDSLPPGWATDIAVLELSGAIVDHRDDHLVIRSPHNPWHHWGSVVFVTEERAVGDADRWVATFQAEFPAATWVSIGLIRRPVDDGAWTALGLPVEDDAVLTTSALPRQTPLAQGYAVRPMDGADWDRSLETAVAENERTGAEDPATYRKFMERRIATRQDLSERGVACYFGAFAVDELVAQLGIVRCGTTARYQDVRTEAAHRRRGLASHLLGAAARWAHERGCTRWVIVTESDNPASRVYRAVGFEPDVGNAQAYRKPPR